MPITFPEYPVWEVLEAEEDVLESSRGLEPGYRKKISGGHKITFVMDSGAVKTIVPPDALPGMQIKKTKNTGTEQLESILHLL